MPLGSALVTGAAFESLAVDVLARLGFALRRRGGPGDAGVDLIGRLEVPRTQEALQVIAQCKGEARNLGPAYVREFEGVLSLRSRTPAAAAAASESPLLGLLVSSSPFTPGSLRSVNIHFASSPGVVSLFYLRLSFLAMDAVLCRVAAAARLQAGPELVPSSAAGTLAASGHHRQPPPQPNGTLHPPTLCGSLAAVSC